MTYFIEERQPDEWERLLPSMGPRPRRETLRDYVYEGLDELGRRHVGDRRQALYYGIDRQADPAVRYDEPEPRPWERADVQLFVRRLLRDLPALEAGVVRMRWGIGQPERAQTYICFHCGISRTTSYKAERRAFRRMRVACGLPAEPAAGQGGDVEPLRRTAAA